MTSPAILIKRIYEPPSETDGFRVLVDRLWPRGVSKGDARIDLWAKSLAPSTELRKWFNHEDERFESFTRKYIAELENADLADVAELLNRHPIVTLLYAARDQRCNHAVVLRDFLDALATG